VCVCSVCVCAVCVCVWVCGCVCVGGWVGVRLYHKCCIQYTCILVLFLVGTSYENHSLFRCSVSHLQIRVRTKVTSDSCDMYVFIFCISE